MPTKLLPVAANVHAATRMLTDAGISSARVDSELLAAHVLGIDRLRLAALMMAGRIEFSAAQQAHYRDLIERRATRIPLQHITQSAHFYGKDYVVGPGVFIPRPETEMLAAWAINAMKTTPTGIAVDLCSGSGALAISIASRFCDATVFAVEDDPAASTYTSLNIAKYAPQVALVDADVTDPSVLDGVHADVVVCNPPYIPVGAALEPEVIDHDPHHALFSGDDGLDLMRSLMPNLARITRPGGQIALEHDDSHGAGVVELLRSAGFDAVTQHADLAGKPRIVTGTRMDA